MKTTSATPASPIPVPEIDTDEPVAVVPIASVAPLDGPPDGERIHTFALAPKKGGGSMKGSADKLLGEVRDRAVRKPFTYAVAAFSLGYLLARMLR